MKTSFVLPSLLVAALGTASVFAADTDNAAAGSYVKDSAIFVAVKSKLKQEHVSSYQHLDVTTDSNGVVWLRGTVETQAEADRAVALAQAAENVKAVHSELVVKTLVVKTAN